MNQQTPLRHQRTPLQGEPVMTQSVFKSSRHRQPGKYIAFLGGADTHGKYIADPFAALVGQELDIPTANLGRSDGGLDAFADDPVLLRECAKARLTVVQVMGAARLSNRFYTVDPQDNLRKTGVSTVLQAIYHELDFTHYKTVDELLRAMMAVSVRRMDIVVQELRAAWLARMRQILQHIGPRSMLLWFSEHAPDIRHWSLHPQQLQAEALFITKTMIDELRPLVRDVVLACPSPAALAQGTQGMVIPPTEHWEATKRLSVACHAEACATLAPAIKAQIQRQ